MESLSLYIHIPFCKSKCYYCDFISFSSSEDKYRLYINALKKEIEYVSSRIGDTLIDTIFIGGGTPTLLSTPLLKELISSLKLFNIDKNAEISIESNPGTLDDDKIALISESSINRVSLGLQTTDNRLLKDIGRIHNYEIFLENYNNLRKVGIDNINTDLMFGLPGQDDLLLKDTLKKITNIKPEHISCYGLTIEKGTSFYKKFHKGILSLPTEEQERNMYHNIRSFLDQKGYKHYEISNFAKLGYECRHNLVYWQGKPYIGLGLGAHSYYKYERYRNEVNLDKYIGDIIKGDFNRYEVVYNDQISRMEEFMFLGLRLIEGISICDFKNRFKKDINDVYGQQLKKLVSLGLIEIYRGSIKLTYKGIDVSNTVLSYFLQ